MLIILQLNNGNLEECTLKNNNLFLVIQIQITTAYHSIYN